jgi:hypothetical protein
VGVPTTYLINKNSCNADFPGLKPNFSSRGPLSDLAKV